MSILVVMRLAEMRRIHPAQIESVCDGCGQKVGIYPSGQNIIAADPRTRVLCNHCTDPTKATGFAPGALAEPRQSIDNPKLKR